MTSSRSGNLNDAICCARRCAMSSSNESSAPGCSTTHAHAFSPKTGSGHGDQTHLLHCAEPEDQVLDFVATDFLAASIDEVLATTLGVDIAPALPDDVAHSVETVFGERLGVDVGCVVVAANGVGTSGDQLARFSVSHDALPIVEHRDLVPFADRCTGALQQQVVGVSQPRHVDQAFSGAVDLLRHAPELAAKTLAEFWRQPGATVLHDPQRRHVELLARLPVTHVVISGTTAATLVTRSRAMVVKTSAASVLPCDDERAAGMEDPKHARTGEVVVVPKRQDGKEHGVRREPGDL